MERILSEISIEGWVKLKPSRKEHFRKRKQPRKGMESRRPEVYKETPKYYLVIQ